MIGSIARGLYRQIVLLYPEPFRREFGEEMLSVFSECQGTQNTSFLLADGLLTALRQQLRYSTAPAPERTALYSEVASSPGLARGLATAVIAVAIAAGIFAKDQRPRTRSWPTIRIEHRIWYLQCSNETACQRLLRSKRGKGE